jgi:hypothetical protein
MLLTTTGGGVAVHLTAAAKTPDDGREAVPGDFVDADGGGLTDVPDGYDRAALTEPRWAETTLCGREWAVIVGGDGGAIGRYGGVAYAPTCRCCLTLIDRRCRRQSRHATRAGRVAARRLLAAALRRPDRQGAHRRAASDDRLVAVLHCRRGTSFNLP